MIGYSLTMPAAPWISRASSRALAGDPDVVSFANETASYCSWSRFLQPAELECEQVALDDFGVHHDQLLLLQLVGGDRPAAELDSSVGVVEGRVEGRHRRPDGAPRDTEASLGETRQRVLEPGGSGRMASAGTRQSRKPAARSPRPE